MATGRVNVSGGLIPNQVISYDEFNPFNVIAVDRVSPNNKMVFLVKGDDKKNYLFNRQSSPFQFSKSELDSEGNITKTVILQSLPSNISTEDYFKRGFLVDKNGNSYGLTAIKKTNPNNGNTEYYYHVLKHSSEGSLLLSKEIGVFTDYTPNYQYSLLPNEDLKGDVIMLNTSLYDLNLNLINGDIYNKSSYDRVYNTKLDNSGNRCAILYDTDGVYVKKINKIGTQIYKSQRLGTINETPNFILPNSEGNKFYISIKRTTAGVLDINGTYTQVNPLITASDIATCYFTEFDEDGYPYFFVVGDQLAAGTLFKMTPNLDIVWAVRCSLDQSDTIVSFLKLFNSGNTGWIYLLNSRFNSREISVKLFDGLIKK